MFQCIVLWSQRLWVAKPHRHHVPWLSGRWDQVSVPMPKIHPEFSTGPTSLFTHLTLTALPCPIMLTGQS